MNFHSVSRPTTAVSLPSANSAGHDLTLKILRREALTRVLTIPGSSCRRAYVAGDLDIDGELDALFDLKVPPLRSLLKIENLRALLSVVGVDTLRPIAPPSIEAKQRGSLHSRSRDRKQFLITMTFRTISTKWCSALR